MPNHVANILTIHAEGDKLTEILDAVRTEESVFDFNRIIPMPESLAVEDGSIGDNAVAYIKTKIQGEQSITNAGRDLIKRFEDEYKGEELGRALMLGLTYIHNKASYGCTTWYDWSRFNWGTKWNAYNVEVVGNAVYFSTAWSAPEPIFKALSKMFPDVRFDVVFADEDCGYNTGEGNFLDGVGNMYHPDGGSDDGYELYFRTHEWARDDMEKDENGEWKRKEE